MSNDEQIPGGNTLMSESMCYGLGMVCELGAADVFDAPVAVQISNRELLILSPLHHSICKRAYYHP